MNRPLQSQNFSITSEWANATFNDIEDSLEGSFDIEPGQYIGRGEYFVATSGTGSEKFIKVVLGDGIDSELNRRIEGEILASSLHLPSTDLISPVVIQYVKESSNFPGDFYIVSDFKDDTETLELSKASLPLTDLAKIGAFLFRLESVTVPPQNPARRAMDVLDGLSLLANKGNIETGAQLTKGTIQALEIINQEATNIENALEKVTKVGSRKFFSHGDLKFSQFLINGETGKIFLCDWEECGSAHFANDLCFLAGDLFYSTIRELVDTNIKNIKGSSIIQEAYDNATLEAVSKVNAILTGYSSERGYSLTSDEKRIISIRIGLAGLFRLYTVSAKSNELRPRELALASIGMQITLGQAPNLVFTDSKVV